MVGFSRPFFVLDRSFSLFQLSLFGFTRPSHGPLGRGPTIGLAEKLSIDLTSIFQTIYGHNGPHSSLILGQVCNRWGPFSLKKVSSKTFQPFFTRERNDENQTNNPTSDRNCHTCQPVTGSRCGRWTIQIFKIFPGSSAKVGSSTDGLQTNGHAPIDPFPGEPGTVILCDPRPCKFSATTANQEYKVILGQPCQCSQTTASAD